MKLEEIQQNVVLSEGIKSEAYRLKVNRKSFKLLYGDLYSYKIRAIIRELSTNACDSHVAAGKPDVPFEVHFPNDLEPHFSVKDYGTGMSPEKVRDVYTVLFESDKTESNDYTGCLGLGSKSPFNYTESFSVETVCDGKKYIYANFLDKDGVPHFAAVGEFPSDEPNGVEVKFPVQNKDFAEFIGEAAKVYKWFKVKPIIQGVESLDMADEIYLTQGSTYGVAKANRAISHVVMGNVSYPISAGDFSWSQLDDVEKGVIGWGVDLFVETGDVEFVPSRERLSLTEKTIKAIKRYLKDAIASIRVELEKEVNSAPTVWQARTLLHKIKHSILGKVRPTTAIKYKDEPIEDYISTNKDYDDTAPRPIFEIISKKKTRKGTERYRATVVETIPCDGTKIFLNDLERGADSRVIYHLQTINNSGVNAHDAKAYIITPPGSGLTQKYLDVSGVGEVIIKVSTLPKPPKKPRSKNPDGTPRSYTKRTVLQEYVGHGRYFSDYWRDVEVDVKDGGCYVTISYGQIVSENGGKIQPEVIADKFQALKTLNPDFKLYGIRPGNLEKMGKHQHKWQKLNEYTEKAVQYNANLLNDLALAKQLNKIDDVESIEKYKPELFDYNSTFRAFIQRLKEARKAQANEKVQALSTLMRHDIPESEEDLVNLKDSVYEIYPMLKFIDWSDYYRDGFVDSVTEYIQAIDNMQETVREAV